MMGIKDNEKRGKRHKIKNIIFFFFPFFFSFLFI